MDCYERKNWKSKTWQKLSFSRKRKTGNKTKTDEDETANEFNKYYADISPSLAKISLIHRCRLKVF